MTLDHEPRIAPAPQPSPYPLTATSAAAPGPNPNPKAELVWRYLLKVTNTVNPSSIPGSTLTKLF